MTNSKEEITLKEFITNLRNAQTKEEIDWAWSDISEINKKRVNHKSYKKKEAVMDYEDNYSDDDYTDNFYLSEEEKHKKQNNKNVKSGIMFTLNFKIKAFEIARSQSYAAYQKWLDKDLMDSYFFEAVYTVVTKRKFDLESYTNSQLNKYIIRSVMGEIQNRVIKEYAHRKQNKYYESEDALDALNELNEYIENQPIQFQLHIERVGLKNIFSKRELEIYEYLASGYTQKEVGEILGVSQQYISKANKRAINKLKAFRMNFETFGKIARDQLETYKSMQSFLTQLNDTRKYDPFNKFDYFAKTKDFILQYHTVNRNYTNPQYNLIDVIVDNLKKNEFDLFDAVINEQYVSKSEKARFVNCINRIFIKELAHQKEVTGAVYEDIVEYYHEDYDLFIGLIS